MPVGATTATLLRVVSLNSCSKVDFPVPALPVTKYDSSVYSKKDKQDLKSEVNASGSKRDADNLFVICDVQMYDLQFRGRHWKKAKIHFWFALFYTLKVRLPDSLFNRFYKWFIPDFFSGNFG